MGKIMKNNKSYGGDYVLPIASANSLGGIKVGQNLSIDADGTLNVTGGGGGGSSLEGDISIFKSTVSTPILPDKFRRVTAAGTKYFNYVDIYSIYDMITSTGTQINGFENVTDPSDTINLYINGLTQVPLYELKRIFKSGNSMITDLNSDGSFYSFEIQEFSYGVSYVWTVSGSGVLNIEWDPSTGAMLSASINFTINSARNNSTNKIYVPSTGTQNNYNGILDPSFGFSMKYVGYYVS